MWRPDHGGMQGNEEEVSLGNEGALTHLIDPTPLLGIARLRAVEDVEVIGRRAAILRAVPSIDEDVYEPGVAHPGGGHGTRRRPRARDRAARRRRGVDPGLVRRDLDPAVFVLEFPAGEPPEEVRVATPRVVTLSEASSLVSFTILVPGDALPDGLHLVRCSLPGDDAAYGLHLAYVVDPGAVHHIEVSQGPEVAAEEPVAWSDWRALHREW